MMTAVTTPKTYVWPVWSLATISREYRWPQSISTWQRAVEGKGATRQTPTNSGLSAQDSVKCEDEFLLMNVLNTIWKAVGTHSILLNTSQLFSFVFWNIYSYIRQISYYGCSNCITLKHDNHSCLYLSRLALKSTRKIVVEAKPER